MKNTTKMMYLLYLNICNSSVYLQTFSALELSPPRVLPPPPPTPVVSSPVSTPESEVSGRVRYLKSKKKHNVINLKKHLIKEVIKVFQNRF